MPNRLASELSPYLLQHADNPVDWQPWDAAALAQARNEQKPIFLSIGYAACHWCHVMAHESFEDPQIARRLNEHFVSVKVDREERPELDQIYMEAVQAMSGHGGWPLSVFLTPSQEPLFGGTYWPPSSRGGMPGFGQVLDAVIDAWQNRREEVLAQAARLSESLREHEALPSPADSAELDDRPLAAAEEALSRAFDPQYGGFGQAPKFPQAIGLELLLRRWRRSRRDELLQMVALSLERMAAGGIYDQLGGGFHRYSVDAQWLVPHFEKMLYDSALLAGCYLSAFEATGNQTFARVARETLDYVLRDMADPAGGFYSSEDADSEGREGTFYLWTPAEVEAVLGPEAAKTFCHVYDVSEPGNFEGRNILNLSKPIEVCAKMLGRPAEQLAAEMDDGRRKLLAARAERVRPGRDDKVLVNWNGLMIEALARGGAVLGEPRYLDAAERAAGFLRGLSQFSLSENATVPFQPAGRLLHCWRQGRAKHAALLDDYAALGNALVTLHDTRPDRRWLDAAVTLADQLLAQFADPERGGFFYTAADHEPLIIRRKDMLDSSTPGGNGLAATFLLRLGRLANRRDYVSAAEQTLRASFALMQQLPTATGQLLVALDMYLDAIPSSQSDG